MGFPASSVTTIFSGSPLLVRRRRNTASSTSRSIKTGLAIYLAQTGLGRGVGVTSNVGIPPLLTRPSDDERTRMRVTDRHGCFGLKSGGNAVDRQFTWLLVVPNSKAVGTFALPTSAGEPA